MKFYDAWEGTVVKWQFAFQILFCALVQLFLMKAFLDIFKYPLIIFYNSLCSIHFIIIIVIVIIVIIIIINIINIIIIIIIIIIFVVCLFVCLLTRLHRLLYSTKVYVFSPCVACFMSSSSNIDKRLSTFAEFFVFPLKIFFSRDIERIFEKVAFKSSGEFSVFFVCLMSVFRSKNEVKQWHLRRRHRHHYHHHHHGNDDDG